MNEVVACLATIPSRKKELRLVCESLLPQVDRLFIYFNNYKESEVPLWAKSVDKVEYETSSDGEYGDLGDVGKFYFCSEEMKDKYGITGLVFTCDDDIVYPEWYVSRTVGYLERSAGKRVVFSYHGSTLPRKCTDYHPQKKLLPCKGTVRRLSQVHVAGTGCMAFHLGLFCPSLDMFEYTNMSDIYVANWAKQSNVSLYVLPHERGDFQVLNVKETIWSSTSKRDKSEKDRSRQTNSVVSGLTWEPLSRPQL